MSNQFKPGDLALVIGGETFLGNQVEVQRWVNPGDEIIGPRGGIWRLNPSAPAGGWLVSCQGKLCVKLPRCLMPLRGDFAPEQQKAKEAEPCA
ncbi:hypothetical protein BTW15_01330 [Pseudomonas syringae pv. tomato]|uniref:Uncharacterized protein n=1 Tax=Pseudomonas syringae pv. tomato TaxID=323 RepID=A0AB36L013_PSEUB|nr:hypothetical protein [Pseudomonas syringae group genomosp. 3]KPB83827.1 hypothetical protein AC505_1159 [Pseudomonas syringae pv. maculicola]MBX6510487.1 hypothetical protein [Pseudomonas syringae pv. tomato]OPE62019.1 hypothetical protein BTW15_01330 [Pseudomonas syringae pv. tomato]